MYLARSQPEGLVLALVSMVCWGSWSNTVVFCGDRLRFELYYVNYVIAILLTSILAAVTLGMLTISGCEACSLRTIPEDLETRGDRFALGIAAGTIFNLANLMLTKGIQMCGLAVAFPLCIGTALVFGTLLTHFLEGGEGSETEPALLFTGVAVAFAAVCAISMVHRLKDVQQAAKAAKADEERPCGEAKAASSGPTLQLPVPSAAAGGCSPGGTAKSPRSPFAAAQRGTAEEKSPMAAVAPPAGEASDEAGAPAVGAGEEAAAPAPAVHVPSTTRKLMVCLVGGVLMSFWAPLNAMAQDGFGNPAGSTGLSPYGAFFAFCIGTFLSTLVLIPIVLAYPLEGGSGVQIRPLVGEYRRASRAGHIYGLLGGFIWAIGTLSNSISGQQLSFAASYAIGQSAPMMGILWGVFLFHEFNGASATVKALLVLVCALYVISISLIAASH